MSIRTVPFALGEYYHIYNRGNSKQKIFNSKEDYVHFIGLLYACNQKDNFKIDNLSKGDTLFDIDRNSPLVSIGAYCLMPNHFHLLITQGDDGNLSKFMQKLSTAYVMYYNKKYKRTGGLFEGKFKSQHLNTDQYLKYVFSYIHFNPIKLIDKEWIEKGIKNKNITLNYLKNYQYSSFLDYSGFKRVEEKILDRKSFPKYFPTEDVFWQEVFDWFNYNLPLGKT